MILIPLIALAIPSFVMGQWLIGPMLFAPQTILGHTVFTLPVHDVMRELAHGFHGAKLMALQATTTGIFWMAIGGLVTAWLFIAQFPAWSVLLKKRFPMIYDILLRKYGFDEFNDVVFVRGAQETGHLCYDVSDVKFIDGVCVDGSGKFIRWFAQTARQLQTGYIYHYALSMVLGLLVFLAWYLGGLS